MQTIFVVNHGSEPFGVSINGKQIGIYRTRADAESAKQRASQLPGFSTSVSDFTITEVDLNQDIWPNGFDDTILPPNATKG
jgi:hypothetical protein